MEAIMIQLRKSSARGHANHDWLNSQHSFSFADYFDPRHMGFSALRVINEDVIAPGAGFPTHAHRNMEILTWVLEGSLEHRDSLGNGSIIRPGEIQRMSAGRGISHSEYNASKDAPVHLLQIWIEPSELGIEPGYEQIVVPGEALRGQFHAVATPDGRDGSVRIRQDATLRVARLAANEAAVHRFAAGRRGWLQVARGALALEGYPLDAGDGAALDREQEISVTASEDSEVLLFDLP
jgi:redox-sensitive bicupin YhaK (pirin superfamily)